MATVLHQLQTSGRLLDGMSYVIEADDGSIIVIDGGMTDYEGDQIAEYLKELTGKNPATVDAWFITHPHQDHVNACQSVALHHAHEVRVKKLIYRFPDPDFIRKVQPVVENEIAVFEEAQKNFVGMERVTPSRGDRFVFGKTEIEVLYTCADLPPLGVGPRQVTNDTSLVIRLIAEGQKILFPADVEDAADEVMIRLYGHGLKSDVCQVAHHGYGSTAEFYRYIDPEILLWPHSEATIRECVYMHKANRFLVAGMHVKDVVLAGRGTRRMELPIRPSDPPYFPVMPSLNKDFNAALSIPRASAAPRMDRPDDPVWEQSEKFVLNPHYHLKPEGAGGDVRILWDEKALYLKVNFFKELLPSNPERYHTADCNNVRLFFSETPRTDYTLGWEEIEGPGCQGNVKCYPEIKHINGKDRLNTHPEIVENVSFPFEGGYTMLIRLAFAESHKAGDVLSLNVEVSGVDEPEGRRTAAFYLVPSLDGLGVAATPADMALIRLN